MSETRPSEARKRNWLMASEREIYVRMEWMRMELRLALALLKTRPQTPVSANFIGETERILDAGPDDPEWQQRYQPVH